MNQKENNLKLRLTKHVQNMVKAWCEWGIKTHTHQFERFRSIVSATQSFEQRFGKKEKKNLCFVKPFLALPNVVHFEHFVNNSM